MSAIKIENGYKFYGSAKNKNVILDRINVCVEYGTIYGLLGASGCGKTTLLSCIVGIRKLNEGNINVLGGVPGQTGSGVPGIRVGYMPQEVALLSEFTIEETLFYFGRIYGMETKDIGERYHTLRKLLELPYGERYIKQLSGGQQRCVSFAASMVHEPELLILDEPTVGLDPLLREKMWSYLSTISKSQNITVIITTHYIEEAKQADCIGMMRNGVLLIENSPEEIMLHLDTSSLEEAFYNLCLKQEGSSHSKSIVENRSTHGNSTLNEALPERKSIVNPNLRKRQDELMSNQSSIKQILALINKTGTSIARQPTGPMAVIYFPIISLLTLYFGVGGQFSGTQLGIVNKEVPNHNDCLNQSLKTTFLNDYECDLHMISCRFVTGINESLATKVFYDSFEKARRDTLTGKINGFVYISSNFSSSVTEVRDKIFSASDGSIDNAEIQVFHQKTNYPITNHIEKELTLTYLNFIKSVLSDCNLSEKLASTPLNLKNPIYGEFDFLYSEFVLPGSFAAMAFYFAMLVTSTVFINERLDGIWDRTLVAGVAMKEMLLAQIIIQSGIVLIQCTLMTIVIIFFFQMENNGSFANFYSLLILDGLCGMFCGMFISIYCQSHTASNFIGTGIFHTIAFLSGSNWPLQGVQTYLRYFAYSLPTSLSSDAFRAIMVRGWDLKYFTVWIAFAATLAWILAFFVLSIIKLKRMT